MGCKSSKSFISPEISILNKKYDINLQKLDLKNNELNILPVEIYNLRNLKELYLSKNQLSSFPTEIGNLINLKELYLNKNKLESLPAEIFKIKNILVINDTSYDINNLNIDNEIIIFTNISAKINNLPINTKEIWLNSHIKKDLIKLPFGCVIKYF